MRNVSGYITDDGEFFEDKKKAEQHEKLLSIGKYMDEFIRVRYEQKLPIKETLQSWEKYKTEIMK
ncbi:MAG: hypothetical protein EBW87_04110 [Burkholderiaceae bacterium]|nr:hypothetical protein [Burkholderiaceae bacterium]